MILEKQLPPSHIKIEFTEGCNLYCGFCGIKAIRNGPGGFKYMKWTTVCNIIRGMKKEGWDKKNLKFDFAGHGEPYLNKDAIDYLKVFRESFPKAYMFSSTNGSGFLKDPTYYIDEVLKYLNIIALDDYAHSGFIPKLLKKYKGKHKIYIYPDVIPYKRNSTRGIVVFPDISKKDLQGRPMTNQAGINGPDYTRIKMRCHRPFREIYFSNTGEVCFCCVDWTHSLPIANINEVPLGDIWNHQRFQAGRREIYHNGRTFKPCYGCDERPYRVGLLPDHMGQLTLPKPKPKDRRIIKCVV